MSKFRKILFMVLAMAMVCSMNCVAASAADVQDTNLQNQDQKVTATLNDPNGRQEINLGITSSQPYVKIWCSNTSAHDYRISILNPAGQEIDYDSAPAYYNTTLYCGHAALAAGSYTIVVKTQGGYALSGSVVIRTSDAAIDSLET